MPAKEPMANFVDIDGELDQNDYPNKVPRRANDCPCCAILVVLLLLVGYIQWVASSKGNITRYEGLTDYNGKFCGVSNSVVDKPFLYFCREGASQTMARRDRICVDNCDVGARECPGGGDSEPYPTTDYAGILCMPLERRLRKVIGDEFLSDPDVTIFLLGIAFSRAWPAIFLSIVLSVVLAFGYLCVISRCKKMLVYAGLFFIVACSLVLGIYLMAVAATGGADGIAGTGDEHISFFAGVLVILFSFGVLTVGLLWAKNLTASLACIKAGAECIWDSPSIVFQPFLHLAVKLSMLVFMAVGFLRLLTWLDSDDKEYAGVTSTRVRLSYAWYNIIFMIFYGFMCAWIIEVNHGISYFCTSYASQLWFFAPYDRVLNSKEAPTFGTCQGYAVAMRYSLGTIIYGSLCIMVFRIPRMLLGCVFYSVQDSNGPVGSCCGKICACFQNAYAGFLRYMNTYTYMDVSLNGSRFCKAAYFSAQTMDHPAVQFFSTHGAAWLIQFIGGCFIAGICGINTYILCRSGYFLGNVGMESAHSDFYIPRPSLMGFLAAGICWITAHPFLVLPGHIADNILFCYAVERKRLARSPASRVASSASMLSRLTSCTTRDTQQHQIGSTVSQPPSVHKLLEEAKHDMSWF